MKRFVDSLRIRSKGVAMQAGLNGVVLTDDPRARGTSVRIPLNLWLQPEGNRITARVWPAESPSRITFFEAQLLPFDSDEPIAEVRWSPPEGGEAFRPFDLDLPVAAASEAPTRLWSDARRFDEELTEAQRTQALKVARSLHEAFAERDVERVLQLTRYRLEETARAFGESPDDLLNGAREAYGKLVQKPGFAPQPIDEETVRLERQGDGQLFLATRNGADWIETPDSFDPFVSLPVSLAFVAGRWVVAR